MSELTGRPPGDPRLRRTTQIHIAVSPAERRLITAAAADDHSTAVGTWLRRTILGAARKAVTAFYCERCCEEMSSNRRLCDECVRESRKKAQRREEPAQFTGSIWAGVDDE